MREGACSIQRSGDYPPMHTDYCIVLSTFADEPTAAMSARTLVEERLAACGTLLPRARSIYRWRDGVEDAEEIVLLLKTRAEKFAALSTRLRELHPYETPEIIALPVAAGLGEYLHWIDQATDEAE